MLSPSGPPLKSMTKRVDALKAYKTFGAAKRAAPRLPLIQINNGRERLYIVAETSTQGVAQTEVSIMSPGPKAYGYAGYVTMRHLDRLGNANRAEAKQPIDFRAFK